MSPPFFGTTVTTTMLRRLPAFLRPSTHTFLRPFSSSSSSSTTTTSTSTTTAIPSAQHPPALYSFLNPSLFSPPPPPSPPPLPPPSSPPASLSPLLSALSSGNPDSAWLSFRSLPLSHLPPPHISHSLISLLLLPHDLPHLKRALASALLLLRHSPHPLLPSTISSLFSSLSSHPSPSPSLSLAAAILRSPSRRLPFSSWGPSTIPLAIRSPNTTLQLLRILEDNCRVALQEKDPEMLPALASFNAVLDACCRELGSLEAADRVLKVMSLCRVTPDARSFGAMAYLYAWQGAATRVAQVETIVRDLGIRDRAVVYMGLVGGYVRCGDVDMVRQSVVRALREWRDHAGSENWEGFGSELCGELVKCFVGGARIKEIVRMIIDSQEVESEMPGIAMECSVGFGVVDACVGLGWLDKAHSILDEMDAQGAPVGLGVYNPILLAYCKEGRTAEAAQLVSQIEAAGLKIDQSSYDALIDASMSAQDFHSAFGLFRGMREAGISDLKSSYLTIMTGLMESHRPELMAGFLDSVIGDPRVEVASHDWNSIIHAFCKVGRLEDAKRTHRRMMFLQFEPTEQTYLSLINGYVSAESYFNVLLLWNEVKKKKLIKFNNALVDAFLYAFVKVGYFDAALEIIEKAQELKIYIDKWRYKHAFMENQKKHKMARMRRKDVKKKEALIAFKNWAGLNT